MALLGSLSTLRAQAPKNPGFDIAFRYIEALLTPGSEVNKRVAALEADQGGRQELEAGVYALEQAYLTKAPEEGRWESHLRHIDIQVVVSGEEYMGHCELGRLSLCEDLTTGKDLLFYNSGPEGSLLRIRAGEAAIFFPADGHMPGLRVGRSGLVRKSVLKVPVA